MGPENKISLTRELMRYAKWNLTATFVNYGSLFVNIIILGRFVEPSAHGRAAIALSIAALFMLLSQFGFGHAIIAYREVEKHFVNSLFTISVIIASLIYILLFLFAPTLGNFYADPSLSLFIKIAGIGVFFALIPTIPAAILQHDLNYKGQAFVTMISALFNLGATVYLAVFGFGIWALILPSIFGNLISGLVSFFISKYRPAFEFDLSCIKKAMNFGISALISNIANFICGNIVPIVMGKVWSSTTMGYYSFAEKQYSKPFDIISSQLGGALFSIFSKISHDLNRIKNAYLRITRLGLFITLPLYSLIIIGVPVFFPLIFGDRWAFAILPLQIFCIIPMARAFSFGSNAVLYALKMPHISARVVTVRLVAYLCVLAAAFIQKWDIVYVVSSIVILDVFSVIGYVLCALIKAKSTFYEFFNFVKRPVAMSALFFVLLLFLIKYLTPLFDIPLIGFIIAAGVSSGIYLLVGYKSFKSEWGLIRQNIQ